MRLLPVLFLFIFSTVVTSTFSSCSGIGRSGNALIIDGDGGPSQRIVNGRRDKVSKKWKSNNYKTKKTKNKPRKRRS